MKRLILGLGLVCASAVSQADVFGLVNGRTADVRTEPQLTVEGGLSLSDDFTTFGAQANYKISPDALIYGTLANVDPDGGDSDIAIGGGVVYQFDQNYLPGYDVAFKGSYHLFSSDIGTFDTDLSDLGFDLIVSPQAPITAIERQVSLFGLVGLHRLAVEVSGGGVTVDDDDFELALGFGAATPMGSGEAYASLELIDELFIGFGYRLAIGQ